jgi:predicted permease
VKVHRPVPALARWLLRLVAPPDHRNAILEDLDQEAAERVPVHGVAATRRWSRRQAIRSIPPLARERVESLSRNLRRPRMTSLRTLRSDFKLVVRRMFDSPGFSLVCIATLALGIGGNTAVFTLIDRVILEPLPVERPSELHRIGDTDACCVMGGLHGPTFSIFSHDLYRRLREAAPEFRHLAAFQANTRPITMGRTDGGTPPQTLNGSFVSGNYFQLFELIPAAGRLIQPSDDERAATPAAVISYRAWQEKFGGRSDVIGAAATLNGVAATIVGVAPPEFYGEVLRPEPTEVWVPLAAEPLLQPASRLVEATNSHWLYLMGRLDPGLQLGPLQERLTHEVRNWLAANARLSDDAREELVRLRVNVVPAAGGMNNLRNAVAPALKLLQVLAAAVLLIACANLASLLLVRGMARRSETAVRTALGASRGRLVSLFLIESLVLGCIGGFFGLILSSAGARAIIDLAFASARNTPIDSTPSPLVIVFAFAASLLTGAVFGVLPALIGSRSSPIEALRGVGRTTDDRGGRLRHSLIALQLALSLVLLTCAGLLARSLSNLETQDFGFQVDGRYVVDLAPSFSMVPPEQLEATYSRLRERLRQIPGVVNLGYSLYAPMSGDNWSHYVSVDGRAPTERLQASWNRVSPGYFDAIGAPIIRGRAFDERDGPGAPLVAVVSQTFATRFFGDTDPIGKRIGPRPTTGAPTRDYEVIGIVGDAKYQDGRLAPFAMYYLPFLQQTGAAAAANARSGIALDRSHYAQGLEIHTSGVVPGFEGEVRRALADVDRRITMSRLTPMDVQIARSFSLERLVARLTAVFGGVALLLACLGLYGVTAYSVARRTREIGIRMAIGATRQRVLQTVFRGALVQLTAGVAVGLPAAFGAGWMLQSQLFGISAHDPLVITTGLTVLALSTCMAAWVPARRAASLDPVTALRQE